MDAKSGEPSNNTCATRMDLDYLRYSLIGKVFNPKRRTLNPRPRPELQG